MKWNRDIVTCTARWLCSVGEHSFKLSNWKPETQMSWCEDDLQTSTTAHYFITSVSKWTVPVLRWNSVQKVLEADDGVLFWIQENQPLWNIFSAYLVTLQNVGMSFHASCTCTNFLHDLSRVLKTMLPVWPLRHFFNSIIWFQCWQKNNIPL